MPGAVACVGTVGRCTYPNSLVGRPRSARRIQFLSRIYHPAVVFVVWLRITYRLAAPHTRISARTFRPYWSALVQQLSWLTHFCCTTHYRDHHFVTCRKTMHDGGCKKLLPTIKVYWFAVRTVSAVIQHRFPPRNTFTIPARRLP